MARPNTHPASMSQLRRKALRRRLESLLSDSRGWPQESAPLRVRAGVMSNLAAQRQARATADRSGRYGEPVTMYRAGRYPVRRLEFSLRPPLAAAAVIAMIVSAAVHFMGGADAWQPWADGLANRYYDVDQDGHRVLGPTLASGEPISDGADVGRDEAQALFTDVARFRAHLNGRIPVAGPQQDRGQPTPSLPVPSQPAPSQPPQRSNGPDSESSS